MNRRLALLALSVALASAASGCSIYRYDRCYVEPERFEQARLLYDKAGSIELVADVLRDAGWRRCEINQIRYRLGREASPQALPS